VGAMYETAKHEPTLAEMLDDPIVQVLMQSDGVQASSLRPMLEQLAREGMLNPKPLP